MSGEVESAATEPAVEDESDSDFDAGFEGTPTETPAAETTASTPAPTPAPAPQYVQVTKEDWESVSQRAAKVDTIEATLGKRFDDAFGKMGGLQRDLAKLMAETPSGQAIEVSEADFEEMARDYPELAEHSAKGLNRILSKFKGTGGMDTQAVEKIVSTQVQSVRGEIVEASLEAVFPGWKEEVKTEQFDAWFKGQAKDVQDLAQSDKLGAAAKMLRLYEKSKEQPTATSSAPVATPAPTPAPISTRQRQIAAAVPPRGDGGHAPAPTEDDEFSNGFNYRSGKN